LIIADFFFNISRRDYRLDKTTDVSIVIKTFERFDNLKRLLDSLRRLNCQLPILVADDSKEPYETKIKTLFPDLNIQYYVLPFDTGLSGGRNFLLERLATSYFVLCDDDFIFDKRSRINWMKEQLVMNNLDILGGVFFEYRPTTGWQWRWHVQMKRLLKRNILLPATIVYNYFGCYTIDNGVCTVTQPTYTPPVTGCDFCHNFFIAKTASVRNVGGWKNELKVGEHEHFFIKAKLNGLRVGTTQEAGIIHANFYDTENDYSFFRTREKEFKVDALKEFGIEKVVNYREVFGYTFEAGANPS